MNESVTPKPLGEATRHCRREGVGVSEIGIELCLFATCQVNFIVSDSGAHVLNSWTQEDQNLQEVCLGCELFFF